MSILAVPNVSEGRDRRAIGALADAARREGARVLDIHSDPTHHRSVLTLWTSEDEMVDALAALAQAARAIDLRAHSGVHPRVGALDVCPVVAHGISLQDAARVARRVGEAIASRARLPVYLYGAAATRDATRDLPALRRGGLEALLARSQRGLKPDLGPEEISRRHGVVCVGARGVLIAFNVWLRCDPSRARAIAAAVRTSGGGPPGVRALGLSMSEPNSSQVSMNLTDPDVTGIDAAFDAVAHHARRHGVSIEGTELVGLVPERYLPDPQKAAARLLMSPGRSLESVLRS